MREVMVVDADLTQCIFADLHLDHPHPLSFWFVSLPPLTSAAGNKRTH